MCIQNPWGEMAVLLWLAEINFSSKNQRVLSSCIPAVAAPESNHDSFRNPWCYELKLKEHTERLMGIYGNCLQVWMNLELLNKFLYLFLFKARNCSYSWKSAGWYSWKTESVHRINTIEWLELPKCCFFLLEKTPCSLLPEHKPDELHRKR